MLPRQYRHKHLHWSCHHGKHHDIANRFTDGWAISNDVDPHLLGLDCFRMKQIEDGVDIVHGDSV